MPGAKDELKTVNISGVEIFASGTWNGHEYTDADLDAMVAAFDALAGKLDPPVKLGHDDKQKLLQQDGYPAAGWVSKLRRKGDKLIADLKDVPAKIGDLIKAGAYKKISSEIYWNYKEGGKVYKRVLKAIALLGADIPAVSSIADIKALYGEGGAVVGYTDEQGQEVYVVEFAETKAVSLEELEQTIDGLMASADSVIKNKTGAPALRAFLREVKAKLRRMMGGGMMPGKPKEMPDDMPDDDEMPKKHSLSLFKTEVNYRDAMHGEMACGKCRWFQPQDWRMTDQGKPARFGRCTMVEGTIFPDDTCDRCEMMPPEAEGLPNYLADDREADRTDHAATMKTEGGESYPAAAYLVVPNVFKPSTWKLRIWESPKAKVTRAQLGRAAAALGPGFRGNPVELSDDEQAKAKRKLRSLYRELGAKDEEIPDYLSKEESVVTEAQFSELQGRVETLTKQLETAQAAASDATAKLAASEATAQTYQERVAQLETSVQSERDARQYSDILQLARKWQHVPGKPEEIATRLQKLAKVDPGEYTARVAEYEQMEQMAVQSGLFSEIGSSRAEENDSPAAKLDRLAATRAAERKISYADALSQVTAENPTLARQYSRDVAIRV